MKDPRDMPKPFESVTASVKHQGAGHWEAKVRVQYRTKPHKERGARFASAAAAFGWVERTMDELTWTPQERLEG